MSDILEVIRRYNFELWNQQRFDIASEIIGEHIVRNSPGKREVLSFAESLDRVRSTWQAAEHVEFSLLHTIVEDDLCTIVYQCDVRFLDGSDLAIASIEVYRVTDGKIVEVWNNSHDRGRWPEAEKL